MLVWKMKVNKWYYSSKRNWLEQNSGIEPFDYLTDDDEIYEIFFGDYASLSNYINEITVDYKQYWADIIELTDSDEQQLEYHNGSPEWDSEIHLNIKQVRIHESLINAIESR